MTIILNTDKNISGNERLDNYVNTTIKEELSRFEDYVTRIEVHLSDENGAKAEVTIADVKQSNGVIHVINAVVQPAVEIEEED